MRRLLRVRMLIVLLALALIPAATLPFAARLRREWAKFWEPRTIPTEQPYVARIVDGYGSATRLLTSTGRGRDARAEHRKVLLLRRPSEGPPIESGKAEDYAEAIASFDSADRDLLQRPHSDENPFSFEEDP